MRDAQYVEFGRARWLAAAAAVLVLGACGGGSSGVGAAASGGGGTLAAPDAVTPIAETVFTVAGDSATVDGIAATGAPIVGGLVTLFDATGKVGTTTTNLLGYYSVPVAGFTSPMLGKVTQGSFTYYSYVLQSPVSGKNAPMNLTKLTDKIVSDFSTALGRTTLSQLTVADLAGNVVKITTIKNDFIKSIAAVLKANGLDAATFDPVASPLTADHSGHDAVLDSLVISSDATRAVSEITPVAAAKQLFKALRDTAGAYSNAANTGELDTAGDKLQASLDKATLFADDETLLIVSKFFEGADLYDKFKAGTSTVNRKNGHTLVYGKTANYSSTGATVPGYLPEYGCEVETVTPVASGSNLDLTGTVALAAAPAAANAFACFGIGLTGGLTTNSLGDGNRRYHVMTFIPQTDGTYKYVHQTRKITFDLRGSPTPTSAREGAARFGTVTATKDISGKYTAFAIAGELSPGFKMLKTKTLAERAKFSHHTVNLDFNIARSASAEVATLAGAIGLINAGGTTASTLTIAPGSTLTEKPGFVETTGQSCSATPAVPVVVGTSIVYIPGTVSCVGITSTVSELSAMNLGAVVTLPDAKFEGNITAGNASTDKTGKGESYQPTTMTLIGKVYESDNAGGYRLLLDGKITVANVNYASVNTSLPETVSNDLKRTVNFDGKLLLKDRPVTQLVLAYKNDTFTTNSLTATFTFDGAFGFGIKANNDTAAHTGLVELASNNGVTFTLPKNTASVRQPIYKAGSLVGYIKLSTKRIDYVDGSFEQF